MIEGKEKKNEEEVKLIKQDQNELIIFKNKFQKIS